MAAEETVRVAAVQMAPVFLDRDGTVDRAVRLIGEAAGRGAKLAAFGETVIPGYPAWLDLSPGSAIWEHPPAKKAYARLAENSLTVPGPEVDRLAAAAREHGIVVVIGIHERVRGGAGHGTIYNAQLIIGADGALLSRHRKLVPTHAERLVWGQGDGTGLAAVPTAAGRVGTLICWEHWMPLARQVMHESAEQIHVAAWPAVHENHLIASRHYAFEGRCFVLAVGQIIAARDLPPGLGAPAGPAGKPDALAYDGGSCIIGPDGAIVAGPIFGREEILIADIALGRIVEESMALDVTGHYNRPDIFQLTVRPLSERFLSSRPEAKPQS